MRALLILGLMVGCAAETPPPEVAGYRDPSALIASKADFDAARFAGRWHQVAHFPDPAIADCAGIVTDWTASGAGFDVTRNCLGPDRRATARARGTAQVRPLGRMSLTLEGADGPLWVLWADTGYRTAILARPDGSGGAIVNREPGLPVDRLRAALEVLDFNGFDTASLVFDGSR